MSQLTLEATIKNFNHAAKRAGQLQKTAVKAQERLEDAISEATKAVKASQKAFRSVEEWSDKMLNVALLGS